MPEYQFLVDTTNTNQYLSKKHGITIHAGTKIDFDPIPPRIKQLEKIGVVKKVEAQAEGKNETGGNEPPAHPILGLPAKDAIDQINDGELTKEELEELYTLETEGKGRKTVLEEIESEIKDLEEANAEKSDENADTDDSTDENE